VQASQAMGGGNLYILRRHVLPHTAALIIALVTYIVPGLVIADAGLDFLSLGISQRPTWGNILANLINNMTPTNGYLWWIFIPVGLSIILISVGFYLVGTAIQEEFSRFT
ncbi:MAG: ABC transporter permease, partial [Thermoprotei archaeon]